ncbi:MAG: glycine cleavage system protein H [Myxococcales bacterium]|nr:glycine cleavage system protein H [Myxococcales bacterium]|tara:strand:+ start:542 stop:913 length:372 start_codon:yes stop_codon:yes gene_type:complete
MVIRDDYRYTKDHEWVSLDADVACVGITDYAQEQLGEVVYVELPTVGTSLSEGESFGVVESTKSVSDLYAPMAGEVVEVNSLLIDAPENINTDPYGDGWMIKMRVESGADALLSAVDYAALTT